MEDAVAAAGDHAGPDGPESEEVAGAFVVAFDTHLGNLVEWCSPPGLALPGLEFKAIPSGAHDLAEDFVYLRCGRLFGLAVCARRELPASTAERGARVRSVGVFGRRAAPLHRHAAFLRRQVERLLDRPGDYAELVAFVGQQRQGRSGNRRDSDDATDPGEGDPLGLDLRFFSSQENALTFDAFFEGYGEQVMILWKFVLLRRRILFYSPPPIGQACHFVLYTCALASGSCGPPLELELFVSVADIDRLRGLPHYAACSTEAILLDKPALWHLAAGDRWQLRASGPVSEQLCHVSPGDRRRFDSVRAEYSRRRSPMDVLRWFADLNRGLNAALDRAAAAEEGNRLSAEAARDLALDLRSRPDRVFLAELIRLRGLDATLAEASCCPL